MTKKLKVLEYSASNANEIGKYYNKDDKALQEVYHIISSEGCESRILWTNDNCKKIIEMQAGDVNLPLAYEGSKGYAALRKCGTDALHTHNYDYALTDCLKDAGAFFIGNFVIMYGEIIAVYDGVFIHFAWDSNFERVVKDRLEGIDPREWAKMKPNDLDE